MKNISHWQKIEPLCLPAVNQNIEIDVSIIGGGITGVMCAYYLRNSGKKVAVFEQATIGSQTTGHTTAKITYLHKTIYQFLIHYYNPEIARLYLESNKEAMNDMEDIINNENINCEYHKNKSFVYTKSQKRVKYIEKEIEALSSLGIQPLVDQHEDIDVLKSVGVEDQAIFHPLKYVFSIVDVCRKLGIEFYENSKAIDFDIQENKTICKCNGFTITSKETIFATRYPQINFPEMYFLKLSQTREHVIYNQGVKKSENSYLSIDTPNESFRPVVGGSIYAGYGHKVGNRTDTIAISKNNKNIFGNKQSNVWSAQDTATNRGIPYIGYFSSKYSHCYMACGFNKWGMTLSHVSAKLLSDIILHKYNPYQMLYSPNYGNPVVSLQSFGKAMQSTFKGMVSNRFAPIGVDLKKEEGKVVRADSKLLAIYKDEKEILHVCKPYCRHLKCVVSFNSLEKTWDCPCHGSRYDVDGKIIEGPAITSLKPMNKKR